MSFFRIIIIESTKKITKIHDVIKIRDISLVIYIDNSDMKNEMKASAVTVFISVENRDAIMMNKRQTYLNSFIEHTMYSNELMKLNLILNIVKIYFENTVINIFINNQIIIKIIRFLKQ